MSFSIQFSRAMNAIEAANKDLFVPATSFYADSKRDEVFGINIADIWVLSRHNGPEIVLAPQAVLSSVVWLGLSSAEVDVKSNAHMQFFLDDCQELAPKSLHDLTDQQPGVEELRRLVLGLKERVAN